MSALTDMEANVLMPAPPCPPGCTCRKHVRTAEHNARIGMSVALTNQAKKKATT